MTRYMATVPEHLPCAVCERLVPSRLFRKGKLSSAYLNRGMVSVADVCKTCIEKNKRNRLTAAQRQRFEEVRATNQQMATANLMAGAEARQNGKRVRAMPVGSAPYDIAVAELEAAWGKPAAQWTLREDFQCTVRMYELLGWRVEDLAVDGNKARQHASNRLPGGRRDGEDDRTD